MSYAAVGARPAPSRLRGERAMERGELPRTRVPPRMPAYLLPMVDEAAAGGGFPLRALAIAGVGLGLYLLYRRRRRAS